jgi:uncharacterized protein
MRAVIFAVVSSLILAINVYLYRRLIRDVTSSKVLRVTGGIALAALLAFPLVMRGFFRGATLNPGAVVGLMLWLGVALFTFLSLVAIELVRRVSRKKGAPEIDPSRRQFLARLSAGTSLATGVGVATFGSFRAFEKPAVTELPIRLKGLPKALDGFSMVQLTDIHVGSIIQDRFLKVLVEVANKCKPDAVAITGDLVDGTPDRLGQYVAQFQKLQSRFGTHFVSGNHDYYSGWPNWVPHLEALGFTVLRNRFVNLGGLQLVGVDDWHGDYDLAQATRGFDPDAPSVLLSHQPSNIEAVANVGIGLQLSGHTHGGQVFPGTLVGGLIWGPRNAGLSQLQNTSIYVSRGCGFVGPPMRVGAPPEVVKVILISA